MKAWIIVLAISTRSGGPVISINLQAMCKAPLSTSSYICAFAALGYRVHFTAVMATAPDSLAWICLVYFDVSARCRTDLVNVATAWHMAQHIHICKQPAFALHLNILST